MRSQISISFLIPMSIIIIVIIFQMLWIKNFKKEAKIISAFLGDNARSIQQDQQVFFNNEVVI